MKVPAPPTLRTPRALLRPFRPDDHGALREAIAASREHLWRFMWPWVVLAERPADLRAKVGHMARDFDAGRDFYLAIRSADDRRFLGGTAFHPLPLRPDAAEIEFWICADLAGAGLGSHVLTHLLDWGFTRWGWDELSWRCEVENRASARVAERCGLRYDRLIRAEQPGPDGARHDTLRFAATREGWAPEPVLAGRDPVGGGVLTSAFPTGAPAGVGVGARIAVLDPAHGGTRLSGRSRPDGAMHGARHANLALCRWVRSRLGSGVALTRDGDHNLGLRDRIERARALGATAFVSVHCTAAPHTIVWVHPGAREPSRRLGEHLARALEVAVCTAPFAVLDPASLGPTAAVVLEVGTGLSGGIDAGDPGVGEALARGLSRLP